MTLSWITGLLRSTDSGDHWSLHMLDQPASGMRLFVITEISLDLTDDGRNFSLAWTGATRRKQHRCPLLTTAAKRAHIAPESTRAPTGVRAGRKLLKEV